MANTEPIPLIFEDEACFVVAGGPSLTGFDFDRLLGCRKIAINRAYEFMPVADVLWWGDSMFWRQHRAGLEMHIASFKATGHLDYEAGEIPDYVHEYRFTGLTGFDPHPGRLRHGNNSAYAAIHLAAHLGAKLIILLGVDMRHGPDGRTHFHGGHGHKHFEATLTKLMLPHFESLAAPLAERGIEVLNASPNSALTVWPRCTIDEGLAAHGRFQVSRSRVRTRYN